MATETTTVYVGDEIEAAINELVADEYDAVDLLGQADVWLDVDVFVNQLEVSVDFDKLRETTDYGGKSDGS